MVGGRSTMIVYAPGVWDMIHIGHIDFLRRAKALGDKLVVGVQSDEFVEKQKGHRPIINTQNRIDTVEALGCVDLAVPYNDYNYLAHAEIVNAGIFALSEDNKNADRFKAVRKNMKVVYLPYNKSISSTDIKNRVIKQSNVWAGIWDKVASTKDDNYKIVGHHNPDVTWQLADYFIKKLSIVSNETILDFGCGAGLILKEIDAHGFGIDISPAMINRAVKHYPKGSFIVCDHIPFRGHFDHIISWGVFHYLPDLKSAEKIVKKMLSLSKSVLLSEIPDIDKRSERLENRKKLGKIINPEPLYYKKSFFTKLGFKVLKDHPDMTDNSKYSFSVIYDKV